MLRHDFEAQRYEYCIILLNKIFAKLFFHLVITVYLFVNKVLLIVE